MSVAFEQLAEIAVAAATPRQGLRMQEAARLLEVHFVGGRVRQGSRFQRVYLQSRLGQKNQRIWNAQAHPSRRLVRCSSRPWSSRS